MPSTAPATLPLVAVERRDAGVAVVTFARAESMNSFDPAVIRELRARIRPLLEDATVRAVVLTGTGKAFSTGADVKSFHRANQEGTATAWVLGATAELHPLLLELASSDKVVVAAVNGVAAGGGLGLALVADYRVGGPDARFAAGYFRLGLSPDGGSTWLLPRLVGMQRTKQFFFENEVMGAQSAFEFGVLDELLEGATPAQLLDRAVEVARAWGRWSAHSRGITKRLLDAQAHNDFASHLDLERGLIAAGAGTSDFKEGVSSFVEKRDPTFR